MMGAGAHYEVDKIGVFRPKMQDVVALGPGEVGFITAQIKQVADTRVGDTITDEKSLLQSPWLASNQLSPSFFVVSFLLMQPTLKICAQRLVNFD